MISGVMAIPSLGRMGGNVVEGENTIRPPSEKRLIYTHSVWAWETLFSASEIRGNGA